jgi:hypothetical protein
MSQSGFTPISIYYSATASNVPTAANLVPGELAINTADGKLYYEDSSGVVQVLATKSTGSIGGSNTQVQFNNSGSLGGSSGLTWDGSFLTTSSIKNSALTSGRVTYAGASGLLTDSANLTFDGTTLSTVGITTTGNTILGNASSDTLNVGNGDLIKDSSGNLGVGVTPSASDSVFKVLDVGQAGNGISGNSGTTQLTQGVYYNSGYKYSVSSTAVGRYEINTGVHKWNIAPSGTAGNAISFTQAMTLNADGHLLVGTTSDFNSAFTMSLKVNSSTGGLIIQPGANDYTAIQFNNAAGTGVGSISVSSTATTYNVTSDQRLKTNIVDAPSGNIDGIKVRSFDWLSNGSHQEYGMVAQELIEVASYAVTKPVNSDDMMQVDYSKLVPMMIKEIQDLKQRITTLENK